MNSFTATISKGDVLRYLGWAGETLTQEMNCLIDSCIQGTICAAVPRYRFIRLPVKQLPNGILLGEQVLLKGNDAHNLLADCKEAYLMGVTIGLPIEQLIRRKFLTAPEEAVIYDAAGSAAVEALADQAEAEIRVLEKKELTCRFSPGYGDLPLESQSQIIKTLDAPRKLGLSLTDTLLLTPTKSITAIMGIGCPVHPVLKGCSICRLKESCQFRKNGQSCGSPKITLF